MMRSVFQRRVELILVAGGPLDFIGPRRRGTWGGAVDDDLDVPAHFERLLGVLVPPFAQYDRLLGGRTPGDRSRPDRGRRAPLPARSRRGLRTRDVACAAQHGLTFDHDGEAIR